MKSQKKLYRPTPIFEAAAKRCGLTSQRAMVLGLITGEAEKRADGIIPKSWILGLFTNDFGLSPSDAVLYLKCFQMWGYLRPSGIRKRRHSTQYASHGHAEFIVSESAQRKFEEFVRSLA